MPQLVADVLRLVDEGPGDWPVGLGRQADNRRSDELSAGVHQTSLSFSADHSDLDQIGFKDQDDRTDEFNRS